MLLKTTKPPSSVLLTSYAFSFHGLVAQLSRRIQRIPQEEQHPNAVNLPEAIEVVEAGAQPLVRRVSLTTLIIVR
jgi:hypothetical protein